MIQTMLGHKTATMTLDTHGHLFPDRLDEVAKQMSDQRAAALREARSATRRTANTGGSEREPCRVLARVPEAKTGPP
ncbi:hypothetical protein [Halostreptopolyspora alba]|uniref:hypothetical protein n=1 Tax=Halostreptopolyspora alba TaxID=2487137 RepID=UPI00371F64B8